MLERLTFCRCVVIAGFVLGGLCGSAHAEIVTFNDANLEYSVREQLGVPEPTPITTDDMLLLDFLGITVCGDFEGIQYATNLQHIYLLFALETDLTLLGGLTDLRHFEFFYADLTDVSPLSGLLDLHIVEIHGTLIADISPLVGLPDLERLTVNGSQVMQIPDLSGLGSLNLLGLRGNQISDISPVGVFTELRALDLGWNQITDISALTGVDIFGALRLDHNQISDISPLAGIDWISRLELSYNQISDISVLADVRLNFLHLEGNPLNQEAYDVYLPLIEANNPDALIYYDPIPEPMALVLTVLGGVGLLGRRRR